MESERRSGVALLIDVDGTLTQGREVALPGASETVAALQAERIPFLVLSNTGTSSDQDVASRLERVLGVPLQARQVLTARSHLLAFLSSLVSASASTRVLYVDPSSPPLPFGEPFHPHTHLPSFQTPLSASHVVVAIFSDGDLPDYVSTIQAVAQLARRGARVCLTAKDETLTAKDGSQIMGPGLIASNLRALLATQQHVPPLLCFGKGGNQGVGAAAVSRLREMGFTGSRHDVSIVGDRLDTDIRAGNQEGFVSVLVQSGCHTYNKDGASSFPRDLPDYVVLESVKDVLPLLSAPRDCFSRLRLDATRRMHRVGLALVQQGSSLGERIAARSLCAPPRRIRSVPANMSAMGI